MENKSEKELREAQAREANAVAGLMLSQQEIVENTLERQDKQIQELQRLVLLSRPSQSTSSALPVSLFAIILLMVMLVFVLVMTMVVSVLLRTQRMIAEQSSLSLPRQRSADNVVLIDSRTNVRRLP